jgi:hypothetical protein
VLLELGNVLLVRPVKSLLRARKIALKHKNSAYGNETVL